MNFYRFNRKVADSCNKQVLLAVLIALVDVQYQATLYRVNTNSKLGTHGICDQVLDILLDNVYSTDYRVIVKLEKLFFKNDVLPIKPYSGPPDENQKEFRWGHNERGDKRIAVLKLMIDDLSNYLQEKPLSRKVKKGVSVSST